MNDHALDELQTINIIQSKGYDAPWAEAHFSIHQVGDACEGLTLEYFPHGYPIRFYNDQHMRDVGDGTVRALKADDRITEEEFLRYAVTTVIAARIGIYG